ncbi:hypothetical protein [Phytohabitans kaempferiae]|uniref:DUF222 domain-containing protein n=1 Tax=Phytohabitans kaempferiae TaxID=1620943 RepID=A0ABV6MC05_9ACTN
MTASENDFPTSPLQAADTAFAALTTGPAPLSLDCDRLGGDLGLPVGQVPLTDLRDWLLEHPRAYPARDAVWRELVLRARLSGPQWVIAAVGMAMPALVRIAADLCDGYQGDPDDIDAEVLTGFLTALKDTVDLARPAPHACLRGAAFRAGRALRLAQHTLLPVPDIEQVAAGPRIPKRPYGHPDLLVERANQLGLIDDEDTQPYIDIRLGHRAPEPIAAAHGLSVDALRMRLMRADARIAAALANGELTGTLSPEAAEQIAKQAEHRDAIRAAAAAARRPHPATAGAALAAA